MPSEEQILHQRVQAARVRSTLHDLYQRIPPLGRAKPGELTFRLFKGQHANYAAALFRYMACTAVHRKYEMAGHAGLAAELLFIRETLARICASGHEPSWSDTTDAFHRNFRRRTKRLRVHATRDDYGDPDLQICFISCRGFAFGATPWVCQQPDWRYRWTPVGLTRLRFMIDCWDAYSRCDFTPEDWLIGVNDFPLSDFLAS